MHKNGRIQQHPAPSFSCSEKDVFRGHLSNLICSIAFTLPSNIAVTLTAETVLQLRDLHSVEHWHFQKKKKKKVLHQNALSPFKEPL